MELAKRRFRIEEVTYVIKDGSRNGKLQTIDGMIEAGIDPLDFLNRFHNGRKLTYFAFGARLPSATVTVELGEGNEHGTDVYHYGLEPRASIRDFIHESTHEIQDKKNRKLELWWEKKDKISRRFGRSACSKVASIFANMAALEEEGFASYLSNPREEPAKRSADVFKSAMAKGIRIRKIPAPEPIKIAGIKFPNLKGWFKKYKGMWWLDLRYCHYELGWHIFKTIHEAGYDIMEIGITKSPVEMLHTYERACKELSLTPLITVRDFARAYGRAFGAKV